MSDFDKEAEREKLREKYGKEEEKRAATEQMSELLLKGATMTNAHCTDCGDPIFRYDGQEFCPTCQKPVARDDPSEGEDHIEVADPSDDATVQFGDGTADEEVAGGDAAADGADGAAVADDGDATVPSGQSDAPDRPTAADAGAEPGTESPRDGAAGVEPPRDGAAPAAGSPREPTDAPPAPPKPSPDSPLDGGSRGRDGDGGSVTGELSAAESVLAETVHRFAQRAAEADDPRTAREHLAAAREAAEALDAVRF